jgi:predicted phage-related endonuclease
MTITKTQPILKLSISQVHLVQERLDLDRDIKKLTDERNAIDDQLQRSLEQHHAVLGMYRARLLLEMQGWTRTTVDTTRLRRECPDMAAQYERTNTGQRLHYVAA